MYELFRQHRERKASAEGSEEDVSESSSKRQPPLKRFESRFAPAPLRNKMLLGFLFP
jgi:hypothetical protein